MAFVELKYEKSPPAIKAHLRYIVHRPGRTGERLSRPLFTHQSEPVAKPAAYTLIDSLRRGGTYYKVVLNFDSLQEDTKKDLNVHAVTERLMQRFQALIRTDVARPLDFVAALHDDHTALRHLHAIVLVHGRLQRATFKSLATELREAATAEALLQRRVRDHVRERLLRFALTVRDAQAHRPMPHAPDRQSAEGGSWYNWRAVYAARQGTQAQRNQHAQLYQNEELSF